MTILFLIVLGLCFGFETALSVGFALLLIGGPFLIGWRLLMRL